MKNLTALLCSSLLLFSSLGATTPSLGTRSQRSIGSTEFSATRSIERQSQQPSVFAPASAPQIRGIELKTLTSQQHEALRSSMAVSVKAEYCFEPSTQRLVFASGQRLSTAFSLRSADEIRSATTSYLSSVAPLLGIVDAQSELRVSAIDKDELGKTHVRVQQYWNEIPVWNSDAMLHFNVAGEVDCFQGRVCATPTNLTSGPFVTPSLAAGEALDHLARSVEVQSMSPLAQQLLAYSGPQTEKVVFPGRNAFDQSVITWHVTIRPNLVQRLEYFIDAQSGKVVFRFNNTCSDGPATANASDLKNNSTTVNSYKFQSNFYLIDASRPMFSAAASTFPNGTVGSIWTIDAHRTDLTDIFNITATNNTWSDKASVSAHTNSAITYEYYRTTHTRSSIDGSGGTIISVIHVTEGGQGMDNAYWNGKLMAYGDGNQAFTSLAAAVDVAAHEMTHGVTENTAALVYLSQSGAINESMSDVFGCFVERKNWKIGEDVVRLTSFPSGALRDMENPHNGAANANQNGWQPAHMNEYMQLPETQDGDNGGVHVNSGIPNRAAFLVQQAVGMTKAEKIYYRTLTKYLTKNAQFIDLRRAAVQSAQDLFSTTEINAVKAAFDAVGILDGNATNTNHDQDPVLGTEWILLHNTDFNADPNSLYIVKPVNPQSSDFHPISTTELNRRPSVVDNGSFAVFVAKDHTLHGITLDFANAKETILSADPVWENVAVSRDGNRMAAISAQADSSIYIFDFEKTPTAVQRFKLYSPTTAQGIRNFNIPFADALEWDYSGRFVVFDALNRIDNGQGDTVEYWNVGTLHAFEPKAKNFADGTILSLFPSLPDGISLGNPSYSKNSPSVIAMDLEDDNNKTYSVIAANIETNDVQVLVSGNASLGFPSYGRLDDKLAYTSLDNSSKSIVNILPLASDRIHTAGAATFLASDAQFPVFFTVGQRPVDVPETTILNDFSLVPNPADLAIRFHVPNYASSEVRVRVFNSLGAECAPTQSLQLDSQGWSSSIDCTSLLSGLYIIQIVGEQGTISMPLVVSH